MLRGIRIRLQLVASQLELVESPADAAVVSQRVVDELHAAIIDLHSDFDLLRTAASRCQPAPAAPPDPDRATICEGDNLMSLFHRVWGHCQVSPEYDKRLWVELEAKIFKLQKGNANG